MKKIYSTLLSLYFFLIPHLAVAFDGGVGRFARFESGFDEYKGPPLTWQDITMAYVIVFCIIWWIVYNTKKENEQKERLSQLEAQRKAAGIDTSQQYVRRKTYDLNPLRKDIDIAIENKLEINFSYRDNKGVLSYRHTLPLERYHKYGKEYVRCFDLDKQAERNFTLAKIRNLVIKD